MKEWSRCSWANPKNPLYIRYHDEEWGIPVHDDYKLFEMLILESFQAGLSWECILNKREAFRQAFDGFDLEKVCGYGEEKLGTGLVFGVAIPNVPKILETVLGFLRIHVDLDFIKISTHMPSVYAASDDLSSFLPCFAVLCGYLILSIFAGFRLLKHLLREETSLASFMAGFKLAWGLSKELEVDGLYSFDEEETERVCRQMREEE